MNDQEYQKAHDNLDRQIEQAKQTIPTVQSTTPAETTWWSTTNAMTISASVLIFGLIICLLAAMLLRQGKSADNVLKTLGTILIIVAALFLVVAGYSDRQISPVIGLLGTIAGYLLGKNGTDSKP